MKPLGLILKNMTTNPYTGRSSGELMVVHQCLNCGKISCNRIAGDDNSYSITCLLEDSHNLNREVVIKLGHQGISLLTQKDKPQVLTALYGYGYQE